MSQLEKQFMKKKALPTIQTQSAKQIILTPTEQSVEINIVTH